MNNAVVSVNKANKVLDALRIRLTDDDTKESIMRAKAVTLRGFKISINHDLTGRDLYCIIKLKYN